ncbi:MAG: 5-(carboxyamino)imidazole ribonucleotide synthase [Alphaproteobacteria bacterium]|nr:5-(carboxyamino)imidazole ribonucleotide synthase [Alphaproteobacteria bacterium]MBV9062371.1 5-(carboxyamino)imidazole ribonucleotide synthase [Alphaproteobacteria bacterium]
MSDLKQLTAPVPPGGTIGILGGGQLGRMLALAAARLGLRTHIYSDEEDSPAFQVSAQRTCASFRDASALERFAAACSVITCEFENVPAETGALLSPLKPVRPNPRALATTQERFEEKSFVSRLGLETAAFLPVNSPADARSAFQQLGASRAVLKTRRMGYDGKGQVLVGSATEAAQACERFEGIPLLLESFVDFEYEASVVAARGTNGDFAAYDPPENTHRHHILHRSTVPSRLRNGQIAEAKRMAREIAEALDYVGVLGVELFVCKDGQLLVNEIAPRVHNSGHWTIDACLVSQFEQHIRAVAGWPLGSTERHSNAVMENLIGEDACDWQALAGRGGALHLYGKSEIRPGRKMGHITWLKPEAGVR